MNKPAGTIGDRLREVRGGLSQSEFASKLAVHEQTLGKYERNKILPGSDVLARLREELGIDINWLLTGQGSMHGERQASPEPRPLTLKEVFDEALMVEVFETISKTYKDEGVHMPERGLAQIASGTYATLVAAYDTADECRIGLKVMMEQLRRELRKPVDDNGTSKRLA